MCIRAETQDTPEAKTGKMKGKNRQFHNHSIRVGDFC